MTSEDKLMKLIASGDQKSFETLFNLHGGKVLGYCLRYLNKEKAEEVSQEVWMRIIRSASNYKPEGKFLNYAFTIARNQCFTSLDKELNSSSEVLNLPDTGELLEDREIKKEAVREVFTVVETLPLNQKAAFLMFYIEDKSLEEIAEFLKITIGGAKTLLFRARATIKEEVGNETF